MVMHITSALFERQLYGYSYGTLTLTLGCASGSVVECRICNWEIAVSNLGRDYFALRSTQPSIPPGR